MDKMIAERADFKMGKRYLSELMAMMTIDHIERGQPIHVLRPAFAVGCEMRPSVMSAIRRENRK